MEGGVLGGEIAMVRKLYKNVKNTAQIRKLIFTAKLPFTLLKPKLIVDPFHLSVGVTKALFNIKEGTMMTRSLPTEIIYSLSPSKNISESLSLFSAQDDDTELLILGDKGMWPKVVGQLEGDEVPLEDIPIFTDVDKVRHIYGVTDEELEEGTLLDAVLTKMSTKEFVSHSLKN